MSVQMIKLASAAVFGFGMFCSAATAATIFDFSGPLSSLGSEETYSEGRFTLDVTSSGGDIHQNQNGIGVMGHGSRRIESPNEVLTFSFSEKVKLLGSVFFEHSDGTEEFDILDGSSNILRSFSISGIPGAERAGGHSLVSLSDLDLIGHTLTFRHTSGSGIRIKEISISAVPLPAGLPMALIAFSGLAFIGRRRKSA